MMRLTSSSWQNYCEMQYNVCPDQVNMPGLGFSLSGALAAGDTTVSSAVDGACTKDYLMIPCGSDMQGQAIKSNGVLCAIRFCGSAFNALNAATVAGPVFSKYLYPNLTNLCIVSFPFLSTHFSEIGAVRIALLHQRTGSQRRWPRKFRCLFDLSTATLSSFRQQLHEYDHLKIELHFRCCTTFSPSHESVIKII